MMEHHIFVLEVYLMQRFVLEACKAGTDVAGIKEYVG